MRFREIAKLGVVTLALSGLAACVQTTASYQAPGFTPSLLAVRGVRLGPLESDAPGPNLGSRDEAELISTLFNQLSKNRKVFITRSPQGFLLNTTLTRNDVDRWISQDCQSFEEPVYNDDGEVVGCVTRRTFTTESHARRSIEANFELIEPANGKVAWAWSGATSQESSRSNQSDCCYPAPPRFPEPPAVREVAGSLMRTAARKLSAGR